MTNIHCAATWALVGLIWIVQVLVYPQFRHVGRAAFCDYHSRHMLRITVIVAPLMLVEVATAAWLLLATGLRDPLFLGSLLFMTINWLSTGLAMVPLHRKLESGLDGQTIEQLIRTNWIRTISWSLRGFLLLAMLQA